MSLLKTSFWSFIATLIRIINGFIVNKVVALYVGPAGMAQLGQFSNFISIALNLGCGGLNNGLVKYTAENKDDPEVMRRILSTGFTMSLFFSTLVSLFILLFRGPLSTYAVKDQQYQSIIVIFGVTLIFFVFNNFLVSILTGYKAIQKVFIINIIISVVSLFLTIFLVSVLSLYGALLSYAVGQSVVFFAAFFIFMKSSYFNSKDFVLRVDREYLLKLLKYSFMALVSAVSLPCSLMFLRNYIGNTLSWDEAGFWQGVLRVSDYYLLAVISTLNIYYLPRLSELKDYRSIRSELFNTYKMVMPVVILMCAAIYITRDLIIRVLFTESFVPMRELFAVQLAGDIFKIAGWLLGYLPIAKGMGKVVVISEVAYNSCFIILSVLLIDRIGLTGVTYGFAVTNLLYFIVMAFFFRKLLFIGGIK
jgi:PST family polysaccharide transporter